MLGWNSPKCIVASEAKSALSKWVRDWLRGKMKTLPTHYAKFWKMKGYEFERIRNIFRWRSATGESLTVECFEGPLEVIASHVLLAVGRTPNTGDLGLDKARSWGRPARLHPRGRSIKTNVPGIWALGDCNGRGARLPILRTTIMRSSPTIFSGATIAAYQTESKLTLYSPIRRSADAA